MAPDPNRTRREAVINMNAYSSMDQRIDNIRVSESDRQIAKEHLRDADFVADLIFRAAENLRSAEGLLSKLFVHRAG